jgi:tyrosinase
MVSDTIQWAQMNATVRWPTTNDASGQSQPDRFRQDFYTHRRMYHDKAGDVLRKSTFNEFATVLEEFHGWMHFGAGGGTGNSNPGHFNPVKYSAFDPIFMLHHA